MIKVTQSKKVVPIEVKNQVEVHLVGGGNAALSKFGAIATHCNMNQISHFEITIHINSKLPPNFRVTQKGALESLISGTDKWQRVIIKSKQVYIRRGSLGKISVD